MREKKIRELSDVTKVQTHVMFVLHNVRMLPSNVRKKKDPSNMTKLQPHVMLVLHNVKIVSSNVRKK